MARTSFSLVWKDAVEVRHCCSWPIQPRTVGRPVLEDTRANLE